MNTPAAPTLIAVDAVHPDAFLRKQCVSAECLGCGQNFPDDDDYSYHFDTHAQMVAAIAETDWQLSRFGLWCADCVPDHEEVDDALPAYVDPGGFHWLATVSCFSVQCTRCRCVLESVCGEAHFGSVRAAVEGAQAVRWLVSAERVWCRMCAELVLGSGDRLSRGARGRSVNS